MSDQEQPPLHVLESATPLSKSMVWRLQRTFYGDQGIAAWSQSKVPQAITTSPNIARAYAQLTRAFWQDLQPSVDPTQPLYIVELGAGSGRFAFRFLKAITELQGNQKFVYVMTDAMPSVVDFWRTNPRLRPFVEAGVLDFAHFDLVDLAPITLLNSGTVLEPATVKNPLTLFANYIFDSIPQDALTIRDGQFFANLVTIRASEPHLDLTAPDSRVRIAIGFSEDDVPTEIAAEPDPLLRDLLQTYLERLDTTTILVPRAALATLRHFQELSHGQLLCIAADIGDSREADLAEHGAPGFGATGGLWLPVNFHALGEYVRRLGGLARHPRAQNLVLNVSMLLFGASNFAHTEHAYGENIDLHGPDEMALLCRALGDHIPQLKLEELLALFRATGWDTDYLVRCIPVVLERLQESEDRLRRELLRGISIGWDLYYPIGEKEDVPFGIGVLLYTLEQYLDALAFFELSLRDFGEDPRTTLNLALTLYRMGRLEDALRWLDRTLELDPASELAQKMRPDVAADLASSTA